MTSTEIAAERTLPNQQEIVLLLLALSMIVSISSGGRAVRSPTRARYSLSVSSGYFVTPVRLSTVEMDGSVISSPAIPADSYRHYYSSSIAY